MQKLSTSDLSESCVFATEHEELAANGIWRIGHTVVRNEFHREATPRDKKFAHLQLCLSGSVDVYAQTSRENCEWQTLEPGKAYVCPPGSDWQWRLNDGAPPWRVLFVRLLADCRPPMTYPESTPYIAHAHSEDLLWAFRRLSRESISGKRAVVFRCLAELIQFHCREIVCHSSPNDKLDKLWAEISCNLAKKWSVTSMATFCGVGKETLRKQCVSDTGRTPAKQLTHLRVQRACQLLLDPKITLEEIAHAVGYETAFSLSKAFHSTVGIRPSSYREKNC